VLLLGTEKRLMLAREVLAVSLVGLPERDFMVLVACGGNVTGLG